jgi:hypothetical protein
VTTAEGDDAVEADAAEGDAAEGEAGEDDGVVPAVADVAVADAARDSASAGRPSPGSHATARRAAAVIEAAGRIGTRIVRLLCCGDDVSTRFMTPHDGVGARGRVGSGPDNVRGPGPAAMS